MSQLAFNVLANSLFNLSVEGDELKRLQKIIQEIQLFLVKEVRLPHKGWWFKLSGQVKKHKLLAEDSRAIIRKIIEDRKTSNESHDDLLDMLLATRYEDTGEPMSTKQLIDEISILFVAGHETTANALAFTSFLLAKHEDVQAKVFEEVRAAKALTSDNLEQIKMLPFTRAVIDESMRLFPPAWITDRENLEDDSIKEYHIRRNTLVGVSFYELHRNPKYWQSPDDFIPERFLGERRKETAGIYFPFGAGPRMCIGMGFAIYEMVLAISQMVYNYQLNTALAKAKVNPLITLKPVDLFVHFKVRDH
jgi:cytochrome P450